MGQYPRISKAIINILALISVVELLPTARDNLAGGFDLNDSYKLFEALLFCCVFGACSYGIGVWIAKLIGRSWDIYLQYFTPLQDSARLKMGIHRNVDLIVVSYIIVPIFSLYIFSDWYYKGKLESSYPILHIAVNFCLFHFLSLIVSLIRCIDKDSLATKLFGPIRYFFPTFWVIIPYLLVLVTIVAFASEYPIVETVCSDIFTSEIGVNLLVFFLFPPAALMPNPIIDQVPWLPTVYTCIFLLGLLFYSLQLRGFILRDPNLKFVEEYEECKREDEIQETTKNDIQDEHRIERFVIALDKKEVAGSPYFEYRSDISPEMQLYRQMKLYQSIEYELNGKIERFILAFFQRQYIPILFVLLLNLVLPKSWFNGWGIPQFFILLWCFYIYFTTLFRSSLYYYPSGALPLSWYKMIKTDIAHNRIGFLLFDGTAGFLGAYFLGLSISEGSILALAFIFFRAWVMLLPYIGQFFHAGITWIAIPNIILILVPPVAIYLKFVFILVSIPNVDNSLGLGLPYECFAIFSMMFLIVAISLLYSSYRGGTALMGLRK